MASTHGKTAVQSLANLSLFFEELDYPQVLLLRLRPWQQRCAVHAG